MHLNIVQKLNAQMLYISQLQQQLEDNGSSTHSNIDQQFYLLIHEIYQHMIQIYQLYHQKYPNTSLINKPDNVNDIQKVLKFIKKVLVEMLSTMIAEKTSENCQIS